MFTLDISHRCSFNLLNHYVSPPCTKFTSNHYFSDSNLMCILHLLNISFF
ncbi:unnamed protein product [Acanthoscelides obtectus]|uniref:Uncharacterized protein n=1 Tax=Acanthoscelides obtectus TaxID=200917 RepID=A0A9P0M2Z3_ACAOB|nr:unnamed protein product [Acanthoscelides obtectus]CAK1624689.1 hypothetical protein AOBTE_LOCUS2701 [Acanthoscelides obtectus]